RFFRAFGRAGQLLSPVLEGECGRGCFMKSLNNLEPISGLTELAPRWARPDQALHYSGLGRTYLHTLIKAGEISSVRISKNGKAKGRAVRLVDLRSIDSWIEKHGPAQPAALNSH